MVIMMQTMTYSIKNISAKPSVGGMVWEAIRGLLFFAILLSYSIVASSLQLTFYILRKAPKILALFLFYGLLIVFGILLSTVTLSYLLLTTVSMNLNLP